MLSKIRFTCQPEPALGYPLKSGSVVSLSLL